MPPLLQRPLGIPPPPSRDLLFLNKGSITPLPPVTNEKEQEVDDAEPR